MCIRDSYYSTQCSNSTFPRNTVTVGTGIIATVSEVPDSLLEHRQRMRCRPPVSAPSAKSRAGQACSMYTSLGLSLRTTRLAVAPIQPNRAGCGNSLSNIKPATVLRLRRAPCSQTSAGSAAPTRVCSSPASPSYFSRLAEPKLVRAPRP